MANYNEVAAYVKKHKSFSIPELQKVFSGDYFDIWSIVQKMVEDNTIELAEGVQYIFTTSATKKAKIADKSAQEDDDLAIRDLRRSLRERRRILIERMTNAIEDDDDDEDEEEIGTEDESLEVLDYDFDDEPFAPAIMMAEKGCKEGMTIFCSDGDYHIKVNGLSLGNTRVVFNILPVGDSIIISDGSATLQSLAEDLSLDEQEVRKTIANFIGYYEGIEVFNDELRIVLDDYENFVSCMMRLFVTMDAIYRIVKSICKGRQESVMPPDPLCLNVLGQVVKNGNASTSYIQRKFHIGFNRAVIIRDWMESMGYVSHLDGEGEKCKVLLSEEEFIKIYGHVGK